MNRFTALLVVALGAAIPAGALAQVPSVPGQLPGTLTPAPQIIPPPPLAIPAPVPPAGQIGVPLAPAAPPLSGTYREPQLNRLTPIYRAPVLRPVPKKRQKKKRRRYRGSELSIVSVA